MRRLEEDAAHQKLKLEAAQKDLHGVSMHFLWGIHSAGTESKRV